MSEAPHVVYLGEGCDPQRLNKLVVINLRFDKVTVHNEGVDYGFSAWCVINSSQSSRAADDFVGQFDTTPRCCQIECYIHC